jgi:hypothetical protein
MLKREDGTSEYALSVYDVQVGKTIAQVGVGSKENEITKAPEAIKLEVISKMVNWRSNPSWERANGPYRRAMDSGRTFVT